jgi:hypothetical protein
MLVQKGGHLWHLWDHRFMGNGREDFDVGGVKAFWCYATYYIAITGFVLNIRCWGCSILLIQGTRDRKDMGARYWSYGYMK